MRSVLTLAATGSLLLAGVAACGTDGEDTAAGGGDRPKVVVTTNILGDVVGEVLGDQADVEVIMPLGSDPHDFAPSARQAEAMADADLLVINGAGFEEGMLSVIESAEDAGAPVFTFADEVELIEFTGEHGHDEGGDEHTDEGEEEHADEGDEHTDEGEEEHTDEGDEHAEEGSDDPHLWTDPARMIEGVEAIGARAGELDGIDAEAVATQTEAYVAELEALDADVEELLANVPDDQRVLVTNHEVFGYFADRYDFDVIGAIIPSLTTGAEASSAGLDELADTIRDEGVPAIFAETTQSTQLAEALADAVGGDVEIVELFTESLGEEGSGADTYLSMIRTDAERIAEALS